MKKIAHVQVIPKMSGVQTISYDILSNLKKEEYDRFLICGTEDGDEGFFNYFDEIGVKVIKVPELKRSIGRHDFNVFFTLYRLFKEHKFDIVHTNSTKPGIVARVAARLAGVANVIHTVHGIAYHKFESPIKRIVYYIIEVFSSLFSHRIVLVNNFYKKYYSLIPFVDVLTIHNGVDFSKLSPNKEHQDIVNILFFARLDTQKNPLQLLRSLNYIKKHNLIDSAIDYKCTITGGGELRAECEKYVENHELCKYVTFTGWSNDKSLAYNSADILCVPSLFEAFGLVFVESGYFSIPAISTNVEGIPEVVLDSESGLLVEPNNTSQLANAIALLINDKEYRSKLGRKAKIHSQEFTINKMVGDYLKLYST